MQIFFSAFLCVLRVSAVNSCAHINHRDAESAEKTQRRHMQMAQRIPFCMVSPKSARKRAKLVTENSRKILRIFCSMPFSPT